MTDFTLIDSTLNSQSWSDDADPITELDGMTMLHAGEDTLSFLRLFARDFRPTA